MSKNITFNDDIDLESPLTPLEYKKKICDKLYKSSSRTSDQMDKCNQVENQIQLMKKLDHIDTKLDQITQK